MENKLSKKMWFGICLFSFMGGIAWNIENMFDNNASCHQRRQQAGKESDQSYERISEAVEPEYGSAACSFGAGAADEVGVQNLQHIISGISCQSCHGAVSQRDGGQNIAIHFHKNSFECTHLSIGTENSAQGKNFPDPAAAKCALQKQRHPHNRHTVKQKQYES